VDDIFDRLGNLIKSFVQNDAISENSRSSSDPDLKDAWDELDEYLRTGKERDQQNPEASDRGTDGGKRPAQGGARPGRPRAGGPPEELRQDYGNLELPFGAPFEAVRKAYKTMLIEYHPDKHSGSQDKQRIANEITKKINYSFQRIKRYHETGGL